MKKITESLNDFFRKFFHMEIKRYPTREKYPERQAIIEAKKHFGDKAIIACEIGVFRGEHALQILKNLNIKKLYLIDPYKRYDDYKGDRGAYEQVYKAKQEAHKNLEKYNHKIVWVEKYSEKAVKDIKEKLDFLYIDGNHFSPYINKDIKNYFPLVKGGGIVSGHDYCGNWREVVYAVNNFFKRDKIVTGYGNDWVIFKDNIMAIKKSS